MNNTFRIYPIGIQNFEDLRNNNNVYVDKTELIYRLANTNKVYFLSRPRRFGKSLLVSTLDAYFRGRKDLFQGLAMERLEKEWNVYPVLHIDFSMTKYTTMADLNERLNLQLCEWERIYGSAPEEEGYAARFSGIIKRAYQQTGLQVVVLIDEYDAPLLDSNHLPELQNELREEMRKFFSPLKAQGEYLRFLFLTGISKFSQMSIFSELNNLQNISMRDDYSAICGITEQELRTQLKADIEMMAQANGETYEEACLHLKQQYDGYHFSKKCEDVYNPFSLFNAFAQKSYENFWFSTGTPTFLINILQQSNFDIRELMGLRLLPNSLMLLQVLSLILSLCFIKVAILLSRATIRNSNFILWLIPTKKCGKDLSSLLCPPTYICRHVKIRFMWFLLSKTCVPENWLNVWRE